MISFRNYITILILMIMVLVLFMFEGVTARFLSDTDKNTPGQEKVDISFTDTVTMDTLNLSSQAIDQQKLQVAIVTDSPEENGVNLLVEWCVYNKYQYRIFTNCPDQKEIEEYDIILFGKYTITDKEDVYLDDYSEMGKTMVFTQTPDVQKITADRKLASFLGIKDVIRVEAEGTGIKIFPDFLIGAERDYIQGDFYGDEDDTAIRVPYYSLRTGYEVYSVALFDEQKEKDVIDQDLPPLLWRTVTKNSFVFVVNSDIFSGVSMLGILTGFMTHTSDCYLYPIINAQTIALLNYPYFSDENAEKINQYYSRTTNAMARDLLWPNIIQILKNYGNTYNFFTAPQLNYQDGIEPEMQYADFYLREISALPGSMGLSLDQRSKSELGSIISANKEFFNENLMDYKIAALYLPDYNEDEIRDLLKNKFFENIRLVMSDYEEGDNLISFINNDVVDVKFNLNGYRHETLDDLQMICIENAIGMTNSQVDIGRVFYPESEDDLWNELSLKWSRGKTYYNDFNKFDKVSIYEMEQRVRRFLALDYRYEKNNKEITINIDNFDKEAFFILSISGNIIDHVENGSAELISDHNYLIKAGNSKVTIHLLEGNKLDKPKNQIIIPSKPER